MNELSEFGKIFMKEVRDDSTLYWESIRTGAAKAEEARELAERIRQKNLTEDFAWIAPLIIDSCLAKFLRMIEQADDVQLVFKECDIQNLSNGLVGELYGINGWVAKLSANPASKLTE